MEHVKTSIHIIKWSMLNLIPELFWLSYQQVSSTKSVEKDVKVLKSKLRDEGVQDKSLEVKLVELQSRGGHSLICFQLSPFLLQTDSTIWNVIQPTS